MKKIECDNCKEEIERRRDIHKINHKNLCKECYREVRINHRKETKELMKKEIEREKGIFHIIPKISKPKAINLSYQEKGVLYKMLLEKMSESQAKDRIKMLNEYEINLFRELKEKHRGSKKLTNEFKEEFTNLIKAK